MSKIKNGGLDQYGAEPFQQQQFGTAGVEGVKAYTQGSDRQWLSGSAMNFHLGAYSPEVLGDGSPQWVWPRSDSPVGTTEVEAVCRHCLQILTAETIKI